jgi:hypothetical protein
VESNKIEFSILWFFCDLLWFFKDSAEINKKEKDKAAYNRVREVKRTVSKVKGGGLFGFFSSEGKTDFRKSWGKKNGLFPLLSWTGRPLLERLLRLITGEGPAQSFRLSPPSSTYIQAQSFLKNVVLARQWGIGDTLLRAYSPKRYWSAYTTFFV